MNIPNPNQTDCDGDGVGDVCELASGTRGDLNGNGVPDECEVDFDDDGDVDLSDFAFFAHYWLIQFGP